MVSKGKRDEENCDLTKVQNVTLKVLEFLLVKFDDAQIAGVAMRMDADPDGGSPPYKADSPVFGLAPFRLNHSEEGFRFFNSFMRLPQLVFPLEQLGPRYVDVESVLDLGIECGDHLLQKFYRIDVAVDLVLNGSEKVSESRRSHQKYLLLWTRT